MHRHRYFHAMELASIILAATLDRQATQCNGNVGAGTARTKVSHGTVEWYRPSAGRTINGKRLARHT